MFSNQDSLWFRSLIKTFAKSQKVYPTLANAISFTAAAPAWGLGNITEIVPVNTITSRFRIDYISLAIFSAAASYEVIVFKGASGSETEIGRIRVHPGATTASVMAVPLFTELIGANTRISARIASASTNADTVTASIAYHIDEE